MHEAYQVVAAVLLHQMHERVVLLLALVLMVVLVVLHAVGWLVLRRMRVQMMTWMKDSS
jgi:biotin transporter BioY